MTFWSFMQHEKNKTALICDLDNTLYDWVGYFVPCFYAMLDKVVEITKCDRDVLLDELRAVHQFHHNSEHPFALLETPTIKAWLNIRKDGLETLNPAFYAFNSMRKKTLKTYDGVSETLEELRKRGVVLIAHSDSNLFAVIDRLTRLKLEKYFDAIYCLEKTSSSHPEGRARSNRFRDFPLKKITALPIKDKKPNPEALLEILTLNNIYVHNAFYVGDSLSKDIWMAKKANVKSIWAQYGAIHDEFMYQKLVRVSHWTEKDIAKENELRAEASKVKPDMILKSAFSEIIDLLASIS